MAEAREDGERKKQHGRGEKVLKDKMEHVCDLVLIYDI